MSVRLLIDAIIQQTMVLIAQVATTAGLRAPLAHVANQVFLDLVAELESQGVGRKVIADMFGLALRSYHAKVQRLSESAGERGRSLWEAVLSWIQEQGEVARADVLRRFRADDGETVASVLRDLTESGLVERDGAGAATRYRAVSGAALGSALRADRTGALPAMLWIMVYRAGESTAAALAERLGLDEPVVAEALEALVADGRVERRVADGESLYSSRMCIIPLGEPVGWEAAVFDHFQAVVATLTSKLRTGKTRSHGADVVGGSTWSMDVWPGHPDYDEAMSLLAELRTRVSGLRSRVTAHNGAIERPASGHEKVVFYLGQYVVSDGGDPVDEGDRDAT